jgi:hypothetical protein
VVAALEDGASTFLHTNASVEAAHQGLHQKRLRQMFYGMPRASVLNGALPTPLPPLDKTYDADVYDYLNKELPNLDPSELTQKQQRNLLAFKKELLTKIATMDIERVPRCIVFEINRNVENKSFKATINLDNKAITITTKSILFVMSLRDLAAALNSVDGFAHWSQQELHRRVHGGELLTMTGRSPMLLRVLGRHDVQSFTGGAYSPHAIGILLPRTLWRKH